MRLAFVRRTAVITATATALSLLVSLAPVAGAAADTPNSATAAPKTLTPFASEKDLVQFLKKRQKQPEARKYGPIPPPAPAPAAAEAAPASAAPAADGITNTQEAGVDEGGIVKKKGDLLIVLRRGRLFTVSTARGGLKPVASIDAFPPGINPGGDWYDEMLVSGDRVIVIGYSYSRGGTEINRFQLSASGQLSYEDTYHLRSNDYYSSRNYASRLIGTRLVVYTPLYLPWNAAENTSWMPALRRWRGPGWTGEFEPTASATNLYVPPSVGNDPSMPSALHSVTECDLAAWRLACTSTGVFGPSGRTFYVSPQAVYVWVNSYQRGDETPGAPSGQLYRLPLDGSAPSAIGVRGMPTDQFSFREDAREGFVNVLVRSEGGGDAMWRPEFASGAVSLLQVPLGAFNDGRVEAEQRFYRMLPRPQGDSWAFQNRFVGDYVLYGLGAGWGRATGGSTLVAASIRGGAAGMFPLPHAVDRIEAMGRDAVVIGSEGDNLHFRAIELSDGFMPRLGDVYTMAGAAQGETRSHAFFFKPEASADRSAGVIGLPVTRAGRPGYGQLRETSASVVFVRRAQRRFAPVGELVARDSGVIDDACQASCVDWYGNSRPIFSGRRTFALMGYELVEGDLRRNSIRETRRISFAPTRR